MSNKTQLQTNNTRLASLIEELKGKAAGSGGSSGTVETCTVNVVCEQGAVYTFVANVYENGVCSAQVDTTTHGIGSTITIENVICGSILYIESGGTAGSPYWGCVGAEIVHGEYGYNCVAFITATAGETAILTLYDDD